MKPAQFLHRQVRLQRLVLSHVLRGFALLFFLLPLREVLLRFLVVLQVLPLQVLASLFYNCKRVHSLELVFLLGLLLEVEAVLQHLLRQPLHLHRQPLVVCDLPLR